ncbi:MAG: Asp-tRNA(Asn)/Glu-tRNA(Gln) amidotransferase subunit GatB [Bacillota bacterium]
MNYEAVIALEVHVELATRSKIFCGCPTTFGAEPNTQVCPICLGHPGVLPVLNRRAVELAVRAALALNCEVHPESVFARKNYFYPDLPKGYQITQYDRPLATGGHLDLEVGGEVRRVRIRRVHLEEDTGKSFHGGDAHGSSPEHSLVDYNRAGVPLIEIVSEPDCRSPAEARAYVEELRSVLEYAGVSDVRMEEGSLRCEPNVSLRPVGSERLGVPVELKNLNSIRAVERALVYEIERQSALLAAGGEVRRETRRWDEGSGTTRLMRVKETADDYRYFPEPDLLPLGLDAAWIESIRRSLPELRAARRERLVRDYGLPPYDAAVLTASRSLADYFEETVRLTGDPKTVSNWLMGDVMRLLNETGVGASVLRGRDSTFPPASLAELVALVQEGTISGKMAKEVLEEAFRTGRSPRDLVREKGLSQISDTAELEAVVDRVIEASPAAVDEFRAGKEKALGFLVGQVMKETEGKANPKLVNELLRKKL